MRLLLVLAAAVPAVGFGAVPAQVKRTAAPGWVEHFAPDLSEAARADAEGTTGDGVQILLRDEQVHAGERVTFRHFALRFLSQDGVQNHSTFSFSFDPTYESLSLHQLVLHRGDKTTDRLPRQEIKILQREPNLEDQLYDGRLSATLILDDIRVGDTLEYAYSLRGSNPIMGRHFVNTFSAEWHDPLPQWRERLLWPAGLPAPDIQNHVAKCVPQVRPIGGRLTEYRWQADRLPGHPSESEAPSWTDAYGWVQVSDFASWNEVARWAAKLFAQAAPAAQQPLPEELQRAAETIRALPDRGAQVIAALRYVQDNYRYLGIEIGANSHQPYSIATVCERRFGDCKDKANLLGTLLRRLGFDADPALVETDYRRTIADWHPTPFAFNHAVVRLRLDGVTYWLDATREHQGGTLGHVYFPGYGQALVVREDTQGLEAVTPGAFADAGTEINDDYQQENYADPAILTIRSVLHGYNADHTRAYYASTNRDKIERDYLNFYARAHPKIRSLAKIEFSDDRDKNEVVINERYEVAEFWGKGNEPSSLKVDAEFYPAELKQCFDLPATRLRAMPYAISFPQRTTQTIHVTLPGKCNLKPIHVEVRDKAFDFSYDRALQPNANNFTLTYRYTALTDTVEADRTPEYVAHVDGALDQLGYNINVSRKLLNARRTNEAAAPSVSPPKTAHAAVARVESDARTVAPATWPRWAPLLLLPVAFASLWSQRLLRRRIATRQTHQKQPPPLPLHHCAWCGRTDTRHPELDFRVGADGRDYCNEHSGLAGSPVRGMGK